MLESKHPCQVHRHYTVLAGPCHIVGHGLRQKNATGSEGSGEQHMRNVKAPMARPPISGQMQDRSGKSKMMMFASRDLLPWGLLRINPEAKPGPETSKMTLHLLPDGHDPQTQKWQMTPKPYKRHSICSPRATAMTPKPPNDARFHIGLKYFGASLAPRSPDPRTEP